MKSTQSALKVSQFTQPGMFSSCTEYIYFILADTLFSADGDYTVTIMTKATLTYTGKVQWSPPAIFKSQCDINVEYFPFDTQVCKLIFLPWSHDGFKVIFQQYK